MDLGFKGKVALVTGSSRGLGLAIAQGLASDGCYVALNSRHIDRLNQASEKIESGCSVHVADVTVVEECDRLIEDVLHKWGRLDILVCNVGSGRSVPPGSETIEEWKRVMNLNLYSATNMVQASRKELSTRSGSIICISSICGQESLGAPLTYSAAKSALNSYVIGVSRVLAKEGIRINAVAPGNILDEGGTWEKKLSEDRRAVEAMLMREVAQQRLGKIEEISNVVCFLASEKSAFVTGSIMIADGGQVRS